MKKYLVGATTAVGLFLLLGQGVPTPPPAGDPGGLAKRIAQLEASKGGSDSRLAALESRVAALEKKATGAAGATPGVAAPPDAAAGGDDDEAAALKKAVLALTTANYKEVKNMANLWLSPMDETATTDAQTHKSNVLAIGKLRYIGADDITAVDLKLRIMYFNKMNKHIGMSEFTIQGQLLKANKDYTFKQPTPLTEEYVYGDIAEVSVLSKTKSSAPPPPL